MKLTKFGPAVVRFRDHGRLKDAPTSGSHKLAAYTDIIPRDLWLTSLALCQPVTKQT